jgi:hypothetical protein
VFADVGETLVGQPDLATLEIRDGPHPSVLDELEPVVDTRRRLSHAAVLAAARRRSRTAARLRWRKRRQMAFTLSRLRRYASASIQTGVRLPATTGRPPQIPVRRVT